MRVFALGLLVSAAQALAFMHPTSALVGMFKCWCLSASSATCMCTS